MSWEGERDYPLMWLRGAIPLLAAAGGLMDPGHATVAIMVALMAAGDVAIHWWLGGTQRTRVMALARDVMYATAFFVGYLGNFDVPALLLAPIVFIQAIAVIGPKTIPWALAVSVGLVSVRMWLSVGAAALFSHPAWLGLIGPVGLLAWGVGRQFWYGQLASQSADAAHDRLRSSLQLVVTHLMTESGMPAPRLERAEVHRLLDSLCQTGGDPNQCQMVAHQLATLLIDQLKTQQILTEREAEVLRLMDLGLTYQQIAQKLQVSAGTVRAHSASIMRKAESHSRGDVLKWARERHLLE